MKARDEGKGGGGGGGGLSGVVGGGLGGDQEGPQPPAKSEPKQSRHPVTQTQSYNRYRQEEQKKAGECRASPSPVDHG